MYCYKGELLPFARRLRQRMTPAERKLWYEFLAKYPIKFYKQRIIGSFIADFYCAKAKLVLELDGNEHHMFDAQEYDEARTKALEKRGMIVLRFDNIEVTNEFKMVCTVINKQVMALLNANG